MFEKELREIIEDLKKVDITSFSDNNKYKDVLRFIKAFDKYCKNKGKTLISIIVPVYNVEEYLTNCLDSICNQTLKEIEIIIINDGSTDNSSEIIKEFQKNDKRIKVITQKNQGLSAARNAGLDIATGEYIGFVDSDDFISPDMYMDLYNKILEYDTDIVICNHYILENDSLRTNSNYSDYLIETDKKYTYYLLRDEAIKNFVWSRLYKKELFDGVRFPIGKVFEDIYLSFYLLGKIKNSYYISEPLYCYRVREGSISRSVNIKIVTDVVNAVYSLYMKIKKKYPDLLTVSFFTTFRWISNMIDIYGKENMLMILKKYKKKISNIFKDIDKVDITRLPDYYKYNEVLELIEVFNSQIFNVI
jgi:glycosyltransferase involved in cell wall biosynthesis